VFDPRPPFRKLVVLIDAELRDKLASEQSWTPELILAGFLALDHLMVWRYADGGPPASLPRRDYGLWGQAVEGWVVARTEPESPFGGIEYATAHGVTRAVMNQGRVDYAGADIASQAYAALAPEEAAQRRAADATAAAVAEALGADLFITERAYLYEPSVLLGRGVTVCRPQDALPLVSFYMRSQGEYVIWRGVDGTGNSIMNEGLYFWVGTRELLPEAWRWYTACVQHSTGSGDDTLLRRRLAAATGAAGAPSARRRAPCPEPAAEQ
jgi:hypothetical protein